MELTPLNTVVLHAKWLILKKPFNASKEIQKEFLDSVIKFNLKSLFTSLTQIYKLSKTLLESAFKYNSVYFTKLLIKNYKFKIKLSYFNNIKITKFKFLKFFDDMKLKSEIKKEIKKEIFNSVARGGDLNLVKFCHNNKYPWNEWTCSAAAKNGHLDCLIYLHDNNCSWGERTCQSAAYNGHLDCLKYLHENNCPWNEETSSDAA